MNLLVFLFWLIALPFVAGLAVVGSVSWVFAFVYYMVPTIFIVFLFVIEVLYDSVRSALRSTGRSASGDN